MERTYLIYFWLFISVLFLGSWLVLFFYLKKLLPPERRGAGRTFILGIAVTILSTLFPALLVQIFLLQLTGGLIGISLVLSLAIAVPLIAFLRNDDFIKGIRSSSISLLIAYFLFFLSQLTIWKSATSEWLGEDDFQFFSRLVLSWVLPLLLTIGFTSKEKWKNSRLISVSSLLLIMFGVLLAFSRFIILQNNPYYSFVNDFLVDVIYYVFVPGIIISVIGSLIFIKRQRSKLLVG